MKLSKKKKGLIAGVALVVVGLVTGQHSFVLQGLNGLSDAVHAVEQDDSKLNGGTQ